MPKASKSKQKYGKVVLVIMILSLCSAAIGGEKTQRSSPVVINEGFFARSIGKLFTVEKDGHKFIIWEGSHKGGITHHPDCPCNKKDK